MILVSFRSYGADPISCVHSLRQIEIPEIDLRTEQERITSAQELIKRVPQYRAAVEQYGQMTNNQKVMGVGETFLLKSYPFYSEVMKVKTLVEKSSEDISLAYYFDFRTKLLDSILNEQSLSKMTVPIKLIGMYRGLWYLSVLEARIDPKEREAHQKRIEDKEKTEEQEEIDEESPDKNDDSQKDTPPPGDAAADASGKKDQEKKDQENQEGEQNSNSKKEKDEGMNDKERDEYEDHIKDPGLQSGDSENSYVIFIRQNGLEDLDKTPFLASSVFESIHSQKFQKSYSLRSSNAEYQLGYYSEIGSAIFIPRKGIRELMLPMHKDLEILTGDYGDFRVKKIAEREFIAIANSGKTLPSKVEVQLTNPPEKALEASQIALLTQKSGIDRNSWPSYIREIVDLYKNNSNYSSLQKVEELAEYFKNSTDFTYASANEMGKQAFADYKQKMNNQLRESGVSRALLYAQNQKFNCDGASRLFATLVRDFYNLPTRVVGGRTLKGQLKVEGIDYLVSSENDPLHAWVEVYIDGKWKSFEVTPKEREQTKDESNSESSSDDLKPFEDQEQSQNDQDSKENKEKLDSDSQAEETKESNDEQENKEKAKDISDNKEDNPQENEKKSEDSNSSKDSDSDTEVDQGDSEGSAKGSPNKSPSDFLEQERNRSDTKNAIKTKEEELEEYFIDSREKQEKRLENLRDQQKKEIEEAKKRIEELKAEKEEEEEKNKSNEKNKDGKKNEAEPNTEEEASIKDSKAFDEKNRNEEDKSLNFKTDVKETRLEKFPETSEGLFLAAGVAEKLRVYFHKGTRKELNSDLTSLFKKSPDIYKSAYMKVKSQVRALTENMWAYDDKSLYSLYGELRRDTQRHAKEIIYLIRHMREFLELIDELSPLTEVEQALYREIQKILEEAQKHADPNSKKLEATERFMGEMNGPLTKALVENMLGGAKDYLKPGSFSNDLLFDWLKTGKLSAIDQANLIAKYYPFVTDGETVYTESRELNLLKASQRDDKNEGIVSASISGFSRWILDPEPSLDTKVALFSKFARGEQKQRGYLKHDMVPGTDKQNEKKISILYFDISGSMGSGHIPRILASSILAFVDKALSERDGHGRSLHHVYIFPFGNRVHVDKGIYIENIEDAALLLRHFVENATQANEGTVIQDCYDHFLDTIVAKFNQSRKSGSASDFRFTKANMFLMSDGDDSSIKFDTIRNSVQNLPEDIQVLFNLVSFGKENENLKKLAAVTNGDRPTMHNYFDTESMEKLIAETQNYHIDEQAFRPIEFDNISWLDTHAFEIALNELKNRRSNYQDYRSQIKPVVEYQGENQNIPPETLYFIKELKNRYPAEQFDYATREMMGEAVLKNYRRVNGRDLGRLYEVEVRALQFFHRWVEGER